MAVIGRKSKYATKMLSIYALMLAFVAIAAVDDLSTRL